SLVVEPLPPDTEPPTTRLGSLPATVCDLAIVRWSSEDPGWGVMSWDVEVRDLSQPDSAWQSWLTDTRQTSGAYRGAPGRSSTFGVGARDLAGNVEPFPAEGQGRVTINACPPRVPSGGLVRNGSFEEPTPETGASPGWGTAGSTGPVLVNDAHSGSW